MIKVFIGYDPREVEAAHVLHHSIQRQASMPVSVTFINRAMLRGILMRERGPLDSTDFSISRFLVPYLCNYEGWSIFVDCDMVCRDDIAKLWAWRDEAFAVRCVQHDYAPHHNRKFLDEAQTRYSRKNWSSVMLLNNPLCSALTRRYVNEAPGLALHQFTWLADDLIGDLPQNWNHLVSYYPYDDKASLVHFTDGGPYFENYRVVDYAKDWFAEQSRARHVDG